MFATIRHTGNSIDQLLGAFLGDAGLPRGWNSGTAPSFSPRIDVRENDKAYLLAVELPGVQEKDINVTVTDGVLTVQGEKSEDRQENESSYNRQERVYGRFERSFPLPEGIETDQIEARFRNGMLEIGLPKNEAAQTTVRTIEVQAA